MTAQPPTASAPARFREITLGLLGGALRTVIALLAALGATALTIRLAQGNVSLALAALWQGAFGNSYAIGTTLVEMTPLLLTGLGVAIAFRAQMFNIGGEGQFLVGSLLASYVALNLPAARRLHSLPLLIVMMAAGALAGALWAGVAAVLKTTRRVPEVISTIMLNFVAVELLSYLVNGPMQRVDHSQPATDSLPDPAALPIIWAETPLHAGFPLAAACAALVWILLSRSALGFTIDLVGANPVAARLSGYSVAGTLLRAMLWSGALCGLAGAVELSGVIGAIPEGYSPGYGYTAVAVALLGRLSVPGVILSALLFGTLSAGSANMERTAGIDHELGFVIQAVALLTLPASRWEGWRGIFTRGRAMRKT